MKMSILKKKRLSVGMTQSEVAKLMGVSQPNYQRWEAGNATIPKVKLKKLANVLKVSVDELLGKPAPFDLLGISKEIGIERKYYGEVSIHFLKGKPLLLPITNATYSRLYEDLQTNRTFVTIDSLDNRKVFIRCAAITDLYFSSDAYGDYGPEEYSDHLGVYPNDNFWMFAEVFEDGDIDDLEEQLGKERIDELIEQLILSDNDLEQLIKDGDVLEEEKEAVRADANKRTNMIIDRARNTYWQFSSGLLRSSYIYDSGVLYNYFSLLEDYDDNDQFIYLDDEGYHRTIVIQKSLLDYISIPKHKFYEGSIEYMAEVVDTE